MKKALALVLAAAMALSFVACGGSGTTTSQTSGSTSTGAASTTGNASGAGLPAANEITAGSAVAFKISRIAEGCSESIFFEKRYCIQHSSYPLLPAGDSTAGNRIGTSPFGEPQSRIIFLV